MTAVPWPDHLLSLEDWDAMPEDNTHRYEVTEGVLYVSPRPASDHQWVLTEVLFHLRSQLPPELRVLPEVEVLLFGPFPATVRVPDLVVIPSALAKSNPKRYSADDVLLAVEVISPGSRRTDQVTKLAEYSDAGIEHYWIVDLERPVSITAYRLIDGEYELIAEVEDTLVVEAPANITIDVTTLTP